MNDKNEHRAGYKHTPLGWIPEEWEVMRLSEICDKFKSGEGITSLQIMDIGSYAVYGGNGLRGYSNKFTHDGEFILIGRQGALCGNIGIVLGKNYISEHAIAVSTNKKSHLQWLRYHLEFLNLNKYSESSAQPGLAVNKLIRLKLILPSFHEQYKIAAILNKWDEAITKIQQLITKLQQRYKGLKQQLMNANSNWEERKLSEIFVRVTRKNTSCSLNVVTISAQRGFVKQNDFFKKLVASETLDNYFLVRRGEFCYNKSYSNGYDWGAIKRLNDFDEAVVTTLYICFRLKDEREYSGDFFEYFFDANLLDEGLAKIAHEGGRAHGLLNVTPGDFFDLKIRVPNIEDQLVIYKILSTAKAELKLIEQRLVKLRQQKKGLMQKLLTGEVRVKTEQNN